MIRRIIRLLNSQVWGIQLLLLLGRNPVYALSHLPYQALHTVAYTVSLHADTDRTLPTRPIHSGASATSEADIDAAEV